MWFLCNGLFDQPSLAEEALVFIFPAAALCSDSNSYPHEAVKQTSTRGGQAIQPGQTFDGFCAETD